MKSTRQDSNVGELVYPKHIHMVHSEAPDGAMGTTDGAIAPNAPAWLRAWVYHNLRRTLLLPSREENISSLGAAVQHNVRRALLLPSRKEKISSLGATVLTG